METDSIPRRGLLGRLAGIAGLSATTGCLGSVGQTTYTFNTFPAGESLGELTDLFVQSDPTSISSQFAVDYGASYKQAVVDRLLSRGSAEAVNWQLAYDRSFGTTTRPEPRFLRDSEGTYYAVTETNRTTITPTRWVFYLDVVDETPGESDTVVTEPPSSLSEMDRLVVRRALETVDGPDGPADVGDRPLGGRGPTFHRGMDPDASALVPDPPFDYVKLGDTYLAARAERGPVELTRYTFGAEPVASARAELETHVESEVVDAVFDAEALDSATVEVLRTATDIASGRLYKETGEPSSELTTITDRLGMTEHVPADRGSYVSLNGAVMGFDGAWYRAALSIREGLL